ncbi:hypothetical protein B0H11DRAFT_2373677 [Mycena galericulata]|nr:hypothetical protein B0H11DRAFT_2373677 [Mycena galericulata]
MRCYQACMRPCTRNPQDDACSYKDAPTLSSRVRALELLALSLEARLQELERSHVRSGPSSQVVLPMETTHGRMLSLEYSFAQMEERVQNLGSNETHYTCGKTFPSKVFADAVVYSTKHPKAQLPPLAVCVPLNLRDRLPALANPIYLHNAIHMSTHIFPSSASLAQITRPQLALTFRRTVLLATTQEITQTLMHKTQLYYSTVNRSTVATHFPPGAEEFVLCNWLDMTWASEDWLDFQPAVMDKIDMSQSFQSRRGMGRGRGRRDATREKRTPEKTGSGKILWANVDVASRAVQKPKGIATNRTHSRIHSFPILLQRSEFSPFSRRHSPERKQAQWQPRHSQGRPNRSRDRLNSTIFGTETLGTSGEKSVIPRASIWPETAPNYPGFRSQRWSDLIGRATDSVDPGNGGVAPNCTLEDNAMVEGPSRLEPGERSRDVPQWPRRRLNLKAVVVVFELIIFMWAAYTTIRYILAYQIVMESRTSRDLSLVLAIVGVASTVLVSAPICLAYLRHIVITRGRDTSIELDKFRQYLRTSLAFSFLTPPLINLTLTIVGRTSRAPVFELRTRCHLDIDVLWSAGQHEQGDCLSTWVVWLGLAVGRLAFTTLIIIAHAVCVHLEAREPLATIEESREAPESPSIRQSWTNHSRILPLPLSPSQLPNTEQQESGVPADFTNDFSTIGHLSGVRRMGIPSQWSNFEQQDSGVSVDLTNAISTIGPLSGVRRLGIPSQWSDTEQQESAFSVDLTNVFSTIGDEEVSLNDFVDNFRYLLSQMHSRSQIVERQNRIYILGSYIRRMPTIESMGSREADSV